VVAVRGNLNRAEDGDANQAHDQEAGGRRTPTEAVVTRHLGARMCAEVFGFG